MNIQSERNESEIGGGRANKDIFVTVRIDPEMLRLLNIATRWGEVSRSNLIRTAITEYLRKVLIIR